MTQEVGNTDEDSSLEELTSQEGRAVVKQVSKKEACHGTMGNRRAAA